MIDIRIGAWRFAPGLWPSLVTAVIFPILLLLGFWQLDRAGQKRVLYEQYREQSTATELDLNTPGILHADKPDRLMWRKVKIAGTFDPEIQIMLDNQISEGRAGYFILTPFRVTGGEDQVLVNRGWMPAPADRSVPPPITTPVEEITIHAAVAALPVTGLFLGGEAIESMGAGIYRVQRIDTGEISALLKRQLPHYVLRLDPASPHGFVRDWPAPGSGEEKHLGYAFQWFALAATLLIIYLVVNLKRSV